MKVLMAYARSLKVHVLSVSLFTWLANLGISLFITLGVYRILEDGTAQSLLLEKSDLYGDFSVWMELIRSHASGFRLLLNQALVLALLYIIFSIFFSGGIYRCFLFKTRPTLRKLLSDSWNIFPSFLKIFLLSLIVWIPALVISLVGFGFLVGYLRQSGNETLFLSLFWIWTVITFLIVSFSISVYDFARIHRMAVVPSTWGAFRAGLSFARRRYGAILLLYLFFLLPFLLIHPLWGSVLRIFGQTPSWLLLFLLHQVFIWMKYLLKALLMHAETEMIPPRPALSAEPKQMLDATV